MLYNFFEFENLFYFILFYLLISLFVPFFAVFFLNSIK